MVDANTNAPGRNGASEVAVCNGASQMALPTFDALGAVVRRASLIAAAVHACDIASTQTKTKSAPFTGHAEEGRPE